jgi:hypothetical protein
MIAAAPGAQMCLEGGGTRASAGWAANSRDVPDRASHPPGTSRLGEFPELRAQRGGAKGTARHDADLV